MEFHKKIDDYLAARDAGYVVHEDDKEVAVDWEERDEYGAYASGWHLLEIENHLFIVMVLHPGRVSDDVMGQAFSLARNVKTQVDYVHTTFKPCGIRTPKHLLLTSTGLKLQDRPVDFHALDRCIMDTAVVAFRMSFNFSIRARARYGRSHIGCFASLLGYELSERNGAFTFSGTRGRTEDAGRTGDADLSELSRLCDDMVDKMRAKDSRTDGEDLWSMDTGVTMDQVAGMDELKDLVRHKVIWPLHHPEEMKRFRITPHSGLLLSGPPGTGKTYFAKALSHEAGCPFRMVSCADLGSPFIHETSKKIHELFDDARKHAPALLVLDEIDQWMGRRGSEEMQKKNSEVASFLMEMNECAASGVFVVGTTNRPDDLDPAVRRHGRLDLQVEVPAPDSRQRARLFAKAMEGRPQETGIDFSRLADLSDGMVAADINYIVNDAALSAAIEGVRISGEMLERITRDSRRAGAAPTRIGFRTAGHGC